MKRDEQKSILAAVGRYVRGLLGPIEKDLKSVSDAVALLPDMFEKRISEIPPAKDGTSVTVEDLTPVLREMVDAIPAAKDGVSVDPEEVRRMVAESVAEIPKPKDGPSEDVIRSMVAEAVASIPKPADGKSVTADELVAALMPRVETEVSKAMLDFERRAQGVLERAVAAFPVPKDGKDALSLDDFTATQEDDGRTVVFSLAVGEQRKEARLSFPVVVDRGFWKDGVMAEKGDGYTHAGSWWVAQRATDTKPDVSNDNWRLAVRRGRDASKSQRASP